MRRVHPLSYQVALHDLKRLLKLHQRRDLCAGIELESALYELGFRHGEPIFNEPPRRGPKKPPPGAEPFHVDLSFVDPHDLLLQITRPPFSDAESGPKRQIALAHTDLELRLHALWREFLETSARNHVRLHPGMYPFLAPGFESRREMTFRQRGWGAPYQELNDQKSGWRKLRGKRRTLVFLLRVEHAWPGGPGYLCAFGMDGCTTYIWAYRLKRDLKHLLERPGFLVAELELGKMPDHTTDLRWSLDWKIEPILVRDLGLRAQA